MLMKNRACRSARLGRRKAFQAIFNAFKWLADNKSCNHKVEWLDDYPLLATSFPRDAFLNLRFLCHPSNHSDERSATVGPLTYAAPTRSQGLTERLIEKGRFVAFTYLDTPFHSQDLRRQILLRQQEAIRDSFKKNHDPENLVVVRSDTLQSNGSNSIKESITNLICAKFFMSNGYMLLEDVGSGPDLIAFKTSILEELRARGFMGRGASVSQLASIRAFGKVIENYKENVSNEEIIAIESESISPQSGMKQLRDGYEGDRFSYMGFFDRRVLAVPFFNQGLKGLDVLTYDTKGIQYQKRDEAPVTTDFWRSKKLAFIGELHNLVKGMLLLNLAFDEIRDMISGRPLTVYQVLQEIPKLEMGIVLDKIEAVI